MQAQAAQQQDAREQALKEQERALAEREKKLAETERTARVASFAAKVDELIAAGQVLPVERAVVVELGSLLEQSGLVVSFAQGDDNHGKSGAQLLQGFLEKLPKRVEFKELAGHTSNDGEAVASFAAPSGYAVSQDRLALHAKAQAYAAQHKVSYAEALTAISKD
jgi:hypothetical protein